MVEDRNEILNKALKLKVASERGDEQIREFAKEKYNQFILDNLISEDEILRYTRADIRPKEQKVVVVNGITFTSIEDFKKYYDQLPFKEKLVVFMDLLIIKK